ncbi:ABC transporter substrate-binding protein [Undibacterium sp. FT147W]|uniref:ABC transporter substrate-binding protein n=1 Tax=Undibacterium rivi TaxID=2828729 RepID=A0ABS5GZ93_9BURK|nr:ABC transporter substrate-binding protein [Undibacterium rivi]MBR7791049.1 ABC transporter substrate-binding protein [Undibacterium rivi]
MKAQTLIILSAGLITLPSIALAETLHLLIQEYAPFSYTEPKTGEIRGFVTDKIMEIMRRAGETPDISSTSLARGLNATLNDDNTCLFAFRRTPERENSFKWVGPLTNDNWVLYGRKNDSRVLKKFEDAKPYSIGSYKNAATGIQLTEQGYHVAFASEDDDNPRLLVNKRIDYWVVSELHGMSLAQQLGFAEDIVRVARYKNIELNMLCNIRMDKQRIDLFNKINRELDNDGTMEKLMRKYGTR